MSRLLEPRPAADVVGRAREQGRIGRFLEDAQRDARALVLRGEPGIGKTTLWRHAVASCRERGYTVVHDPTKVIRVARRTAL